MEVTSAFDNVENVERPLLTRAQAFALGLKRYFTGKPCPHGHVTERLATTGRCCKCQRMAERRVRENFTPEQRARYNAQQRVENMAPEKLARLREQERRHYHARIAAAKELAEKEQQS